MLTLMGDKFSGYGIKIGMFDIPLTKVRVEGNYMPDFTIDIEKPSAISGIMNIIKPKITVLIGKTAYRIEYGKSGVSKVNSEIFNTPTTFDKLQESGMVPIALFAVLMGLIVWKFSRKGVKKT